MNKMMIAVFDSEPAAYAGLSALKDLHKDGHITLYASAVIVKGPSRTFSVRQMPGEEPAGEPGSAALDMLIEGVIGVLAGPVGPTFGNSVDDLTELFFNMAKAGVFDILKGTHPGRK